MYPVGNLTGLEKSVGKLPGLQVGTLQVPWITGICRNFAYASPRVEKTESKKFIVQRSNPGQPLGGAWGDIVFPIRRALCVKHKLVYLSFRYCLRMALYNLQRVVCGYSRRRDYSSVFHMHWSTQNDSREFSLLFAPRNCSTSCKPCSLKNHS